MRNNVKGQEVRGLNKKNKFSRKMNPAVKECRLPVRDSHGRRVMDYVVYENGQAELEMKHGKNLSTVDFNALIRKISRMEE